MNRIPTATYRLQLCAALDFQAVNALIDYLQQLGVSDVYLSPLFRSREESSHGYDVVSHADVEPTFGDIDQFRELTDKVRAQGMGVLLDVVPNHMGINDPGNIWWNDILENGPLSQYASYFDIDWDRPAESLRNKLLLPFLGDYFGTVLESGDLQLKYESDKFQLIYGPKRYPIAPKTWPMILRSVLDSIDDQESPAEDRIELESIIFVLEYLPTRDDTESATDLMRERYREQEVAARRFAQLVQQSPCVDSAFQSSLETINGDTRDPRSFDRLEAMLAAQWYRLAYWRVASDEINYRRFFDINDLAAIRVELPEVFENVHTLVCDLLSSDRITGLRIDHPDGLYDPEDYFDQLQRMYRACIRARHTEADSTEADELYVVAEKILSGAEELPREWQIAGTTGYELMNILGRALVNDVGLKSVVDTYERFIGYHALPVDVIYESKRQILHDSMSSELTMLASRLYRIAQLDRMSRDFTFTSLRRALREVIACFPAYRTYVRSHGWDVDADDHSRISSALRMAKRRNPLLGRALFDFISSVLLLEFPGTLTKEQREQWREFALRFQQVTGPAAAKGVEDTAFYRYFPLLSLNEVGAELTPVADSVEEFHRLMERRSNDWPHALSATATHDTKRGEDTRARLSVLTQVPQHWNDLCDWWRKSTEIMQRELDGQIVPSAPESYFILQTIIGTWPPGGTSADNWESYRNRIHHYLEKALREAKLNTSWAHPSPDYEAAVLEFLGEVLEPTKSADLLRGINDFVQLISDAGFLNSISQLVLKACVPGVPDFYQGTELWDFSLVDPDNRRPVDFDRRQRILGEIQKQFAEDPMACNESLASSWPDERIKLLVTWRLLLLRQQNVTVFAHGKYIPLEVHGELKDHVIAFTRHYDNTWVVVIVPKDVHSLLHGGTPLSAMPHACTIDWRDTVVLLPAAAGQIFQDGLTNNLIWTHDLQHEENLDMDSLTAEVLKRDHALEFEAMSASSSQATQTINRLRESHPGSDPVLKLADVLRIWPMTILISNNHVA